MQIHRLNRSGAYADRAPEGSCKGLEIPSSERIILIDGEVSLGVAGHDDSEVRGCTVIESSFYKRLLEECAQALAHCPPGGAALSGETDVGEALAVDLLRQGFGDRICGFYGNTLNRRPALSAFPLNALEQVTLEVLIVCSDGDKESYLQAADPVRG